MSNLKKYDKNYYEKYAKIILSKIVDSHYSKLTHKDRPDLQDLEKNKYGVEVTRGISENEGNFYSFLNDNMGEGKDKEKLLSIANKRKLDPWISQGDGFTAYSISHGLQDVNSYKKDTITYIEKKMIKLNKNYSLFNSNELFIFLNFSYNKRDIEEIIKKVNFEKYDKIFDKIYLLSYDTLFEYNRNKNSIEEYTISHEDLFQTKRLAQSPHSD